LKKILAIVTTFALLTLFVGVSALSNPIAQISTVNAPVKSGEKVRFSVTISRYENAYATITVSNLEYEKNLLEFEGFEPSRKDFPNSISSSNSTEFSLISSPTNQKIADGSKGGECCVLVFTAKTDITKNTKISAKISANGYTKGKGDNWTDYAPSSVTIKTGGIVEKIEDNSPVDSPIYDQKITSTDAESVAPLGDENKALFAGIIGTLTLISGLFFMRKRS